MILNWLYGVIVMIFVYAFIRRWIASIAPGVLFAYAYIRRWIATVAAELLDRKGA